MIEMNEMIMDEAAMTSNTYLSLVKHEIQGRGSNHTYICLFGDVAQFNDNC